MALSEEHRQKLRASHVGKRGNWLGKKRPDMTGEKHPRWKGGYENVLRLNRARRASKKGAEGSHTTEEWLAVKEIFSFTCPCCGRSEPEIQLTADHIVPLSKGGTDYINNIQPLCLSCNSRKKTKTIKYEPLAA